VHDLTTYIAFLRGINVGGNTMIPMPGLKSMYEKLGFANVRTFIQSGNVLFESKLAEKMLVKKMERALQQKMHKDIPVVIRTSKQLESIVANNPFSKAKPEQVGVMFFPEPVQKELFKGISIPGPEKVEISGREIYIHYPNGMGRSKLKLPALPQKATVRNINTITRLVALSKIPVIGSGQKRGKNAIYESHKLPVFPIHR
jgi:uncharacterized protein (DUF1697 family)